MTPKPCWLILLVSVSLPALARPAAATSPTPKKTPPATSRDRPPVDFSGVWEVDQTMSRGVARTLAGAVLNVTQKGNRIWITPEGQAKKGILADEIVVDGRPYEKSLGPAGKGLVTAEWGKDNRSLTIEVTAGPQENPRSAVQQSVWRLSSDGNVWTRDTVSTSHGKSTHGVLVLRKKKS